jgi:site-specific recombinase XerD
LAIIERTQTVLTTLNEAQQRRVAAGKQKPRTRSTLAAYRTDWRRFAEWCAAGGHVPLPASEDVIVAHLLELSEQMAPASLDRAYATIRVIHKAKGLTLPVQEGVQNCLRNIRRERAAKGLPNIVKKKALEAGQVVEAACMLGRDLAGLRDRMVLLFGFAIGQRRAEIAALRVDDLEFTEDGVVVRVRRSKTRQEGQEHRLIVVREDGPGCPVAAMQAWLRASGLKEGILARRVHRSGRVDPRALAGSGIANIVKEAAARLGLDPKLYGGHSLRRGFVTSAVKAHRDVFEIMATTGHESIKTVQGYIEESSHVDPTRAGGRGLLATSKKDRARLEALTPRAFAKRGAPVAVAWVQEQAELLEARGLSPELAAKVLAKAGVTCDGREITETDL